MNQITPFLLIGLTLICIAMAAELWHTRVVDSRQMAYISELLEQILQNRPVSYVSEEKDTLYGKILVQIKRIDEIKAENNKALLKERDSIKQLLTQIAHQLRTPLANMENYLVLLEEEGISVEDNGIGISQDEENRIFKLYYRGKNTTGYGDFIKVPVLLLI